jgi:hypothetical protein
LIEIRLQNHDLGLHFNKTNNMIQFNAPSLVVKSRIIVNNESVEKVFIYRYWCKIVEYNGEKKPRYLYQDKLSELRRLYEDIFEKNELEEKYVTFIETEGLRMKDGIGSSGKKVSGSNICEFVSIKIKQNNKNT